MANTSNPAPAAAASGPPLVKISRPTAEICALLPLSPEASAAFEPDITPAAFIDRLCVAELYIDAIRFLAHALPPREAVWWSCLAASAASDPGAADQQSAVEAAEAWVYRPDEEHRRVAAAAAASLANDSPARWAATAAAWSGGSLAPPEAPVVPPGPTLTAQAAGGAVLLAAVKTDPEQASNRHRTAIVQAIDIARGGNGRGASTTG